jgi:hypothetical protein
MALTDSLRIANRPGFVKPSAHFGDFETILNFGSEPTTNDHLKQWARVPLFLWLKAGILK